MDHFRRIGTWVDWDNTCDQFLHGSGEVVEVNSENIGLLKNAFAGS